MTEPAPIDTSPAPSPAAAGAQAPTRNGARDARTATPSPPPPSSTPLEDRSLYFNRELSWLDFNDRVLQLAEDDALPLLERVKFCAIHCTNLDEFFMVRVAGLHDQIDAGVERPGIDGSTPSQTISAIHDKALEQDDRRSALLEQTLLGALARHGIQVLSAQDIGDDEREDLRRRFHREIYPALTPLAVGPGRPFPYISNLSLSLAALVRDPSSGHVAFARVKVPKESFPRFLDLGEGRFIALEDVIADNLDALFPGMEVVESDVFRVTRDADLSVSDEADDLLQAVEDELRRRRFGEVVRLEHGASMSDEMRDQLVDALDVGPCDVYAENGRLDLADLWELVRLPGFDDLRDPPWSPVTPAAFEGPAGHVDVMAAMREGDLLVHHPYDSFASSVERFVEQAASDPQVLAIKQTMYRTSDDTTMVPALIRAAERGKQAVCLVELKARFDERLNIQWARALEQAGVHVVYGQPSVKTHAKCLLVVRREGDGVRHYVHIGTGNYHAKTARLYTDFGLFTTDERIGADVADLFNQLTGYGQPHRFREALVAPSHLREGILEEIERTIAAHEAGQRARIALKLNALVDARCIQALYRASQAGVQVDLNVRGVCCLRPGVPGVSENIRVVSLLGRFLEHSRIYTFHRGEEKMVYISSADLMPRNLDNRVELAAPVYEPALRDDLIDAVERCLADTTGTWELQADGSWRRRQADGGRPRSAQNELMLMHSARAADHGAG